MTTNTLISIDLAEPPRLSNPAPIAPPVERSGTPAWRPLFGGCLLKLPRVVWMALDMVILCTGTTLGNELFVWWSGGIRLTDVNQWLTNVVQASAVILAGGIFGLYEPKTIWARSRIVARCFLTVTLAMLLSWAVMHLLMYSSLSRRAAATGFVFFLMFASSYRLLAHRAIRSVRRGLLVIGQGPATGLIIRSVRRGAVPGYRLVGLVAGNGAIDERGLSDVPIVGQLDDIERVCRDHRVAEVVVADRAADDPEFQRAALKCLRLGCRVTNETTFYETAFEEVPAAHITPNWFLLADLKGQCEEHAMFKRVFDLAVAALGIVLAVPFWPLIALAVRLQGSGSVFYAQTRVGHGGRNFTLYKFRTMRGDAESNGTTWAQPNDPRVTFAGRFLRRTRLDELPQMWNILKGDMSLVGPRPERPEFVDPLTSLIPFYSERHLIKPGLTGWAQLNYRYGSTVADARKKLQLDLYYIKHMSLELDLVILLRTLGTFFLGSR
ncbi:MAG: sugar transferase [Planctomycetota bacterium]|nr:sugar transferase [Planctomycetota bacterium]